MGRQDFETETLVAEPFAFTHSGYSNKPAWITGSRTDAIPAGGHHPSSHQGIAVAFSVRGREGGALPEAETDGAAPALRAADGGSSRAMVAFQTRGSNVDVGDVAGTFGSNADRASGSAPMVATAVSETLRSHSGGGGWPDPLRDETLATHGHAVRRLTPRECERLMGFPDDYTRVPYRGRSAEECPDGPRYKALGNSMAVNVMSWIGRRIALVEAIR